MSLAELFSQNSFVLSYELFPPKTDAGMVTLADHLRKLIEFRPDFITCTYGAGGSTRDKTLSTLALVRELTPVPLATHLTCVGSTADELRTYLQRAEAQGIAHVVALRGDAPGGAGAFVPVEGGFRHASELIAFLRAEFPRFGIVAAGYPETHPEALSPEADLDNLKRKVDAGADAIVTQLFYSNTDFFRFRDRCAAMGVSVPVVPGIMPVTNFGQIKRITSMCGASLPAALTETFERVAGDDEGQYQAGVDFATRQVDELLRAGVPGVHFYVLNQSRATSSVLGALNLRP